VSEFVIRRATEADTDGIAQTRAASIRGVCAKDYSPEQIESWAGELPAESHLEFMGKSHYLVAEDDDQLLGFGVADLEGAEILALYVHPEALGRGVGRSLLQAMEGASRDAGRDALQLLSTLTAVGFYERMGYARGEDTSHTLRSGIEMACVRMRKVLG
jgi:putative acetyltransferase